MNFRDVLENSIRRLTQAGVEGATRDARALVAAAGNIAPDRLTLMANDPFPRENMGTLDAMLAARMSHKPVSRILGRRLFWGREFAINDHVLDPRGDTETLIAEALKIPAKRILDMGTGSGALAITLAAEFPDAQVVATDISDDALSQAAVNARNLGVSDRVTFLRSDWFENVTGIFDLIVSNPPYISAKEMNELRPEVKKFDPEIALTPGGDGLACYQAIVQGAGRFLADNGRLAVEIGWRQGPAVRNMFAAANLHTIEVIQDLDGKDRVVSGQLFA